MKPIMIEVTIEVIVDAPTQEGASVVGNLDSAIRDAVSRCLFTHAHATISWGCRITRVLPAGIAMEHLLAIYRKAGLPTPSEDAIGKAKVEPRLVDLAAPFVFLVNYFEEDFDDEVWQGTPFQLLADNYEVGTNLDEEGMVIEIAAALRRAAEGSGIYPIGHTSGVQRKA